MRLHNTYVYAQVGDRIVSINKQSMDGLAHAEVVNILKNAFGAITLEVG